MEEPEDTQATAPAASSANARAPLWRNRWVVIAAALIIVAAVAGVALGAAMGSRQGGPLSSSGVAGGRPTIVVATVAPAASPSVRAVASPSPTAVVVAGATAVAASDYVVKPGDTLRSIAQDQYGDASLWPRIFDANRDVIGDNPDALIAGTKLRIPQ
jgi:nucleoid-associated protein YgaU